MRSLMRFLFSWHWILSLLAASVTATLPLEFKTDIELHSPSGSVNIVTFQYSTTESANLSLEAYAIRFCREYDIQHQFCMTLFSQALDFMIAEFSNRYETDDDKFDVESNILSIELYDKLKGALGVDNISAYQETCNAISRFSWAYRAERVNAFRANLMIALHNDNGVYSSFDTITEKQVDELIWLQYTERYYQLQQSSSLLLPTSSASSINRNPNSGTDFPQVCFIHACTLPDQDISILLEMLETVYTSGLAVTLTKLWVINHGTPFNVESVQKISEYNQRVVKHQQFSQDRLSPSLSPLVSPIERSDDMSRFEITTLRHLHYFALQVNSTHLNAIHTSNITQPKDIQILYLHTKGITYKDSIHQSYTNDWRRVMMYFLVEQHRICYHLLASTLYDIIGINYVDSVPKKYGAHFAGNFWWVSAQYIIREIGSVFLLPDAPKREAEMWLFKPKNNARLYNLHSSFINHYHHPYRSESYINSFKVSSSARAISIYNESL